MNINSQIIFLDCLSEPLLSELFQRVKYDRLETDISSHILNDPLFQAPKSLYVYTIIGSFPYNSSIYISIHENGIEICHVSIHLCPTITENTKLKGPIHTTNKLTKHAVQRLRINKQPNGSFIFSLGGYYGNHLSSKTQYYTLKILDVLNSYFDVTSPDYVGIRKYKQNHPWAKDIFAKKQSAIQEIEYRKRNVYNEIAGLIPGSKAIGRLGTLPETILRYGIGDFVAPRRPPNGGRRKTRGKHHRRRHTRKAH